LPYRFLFRTLGSLARSVLTGLIMRLRTLLKLLALALVARTIARYQRARRPARAAGAAHADPFASDPDDPVQSFDETYELQGTPLDVDALSNEDAEAAQDLMELEVEVDRTVEDDDAALAMAGLEVGGGGSGMNSLVPPRDAGDLYGAHTPAAVDRDHPDDDRATADGQNWVEALETSAIENGAEPERELDSIIDDEDVLRPPHPSSTRDIPIADYGSGGRNGL
jgi:hypothetical protein